MNFFRIIFEPKRIKSKEDELTDDEYIDHYRTKSVDDCPIIIFHGGCLTCISQIYDGIDRCKKCQYFRCDWNKPDLRYQYEKDTLR